MRRRIGHDDNVQRVQLSRYSSLDQADGDIEFRRCGSRAESFYIRMYIDDIHNQIMPFEFRTQQKNLTVSLSPPNQHFAALVAKALYSERRSANLEEALSQFIRECVRQMLWFNTAVFEIADLQQINTSRIVGFELVPLFMCSVRIRDDRVTQHFSNDTPEYLNLPQQIVFPKDRIILFQLPESIRLQHESMMQTLEFLGNSKLKIQTLILAPKKEGVPFDWDYHNEISNQLLLEVTRLTGWQVRGLLQESMLEYYDLNRFLTFQKHIISLRQSIVAELNSALTKIAPRFGAAPSELIVEGLPTLEDVEKALDQLEKGPTSLSSLWSKFRI